MPTRSLTAPRNRCLLPKWRSVVCTDTCPQQGLNRPAAGMDMHFFTAGEGPYGLALVSEGSPERLGRRNRHADGFFAIGAQTEMLSEGMEVEVTLIGARSKPADLVVIGSHCVGLDLILGHLMREGISSKILNVGSTGGLVAAKRGECDIAGMHPMDSTTGEYNRRFLSDALKLIPGYGRLQGIVFRVGDQLLQGFRRKQPLLTFSAIPGA